MTKKREPKFIKPVPPYPPKTKCAMRRTNAGAVYKICYKDSKTASKPVKNPPKPTKKPKSKPVKR